jgi:hypothetical protein
MGEVARILQRDIKVDGAQSVTEVRFVNPFGDVFEDVTDGGRELFRTLGPERIIAQQVPVLFHCRPTASGVDYDRIDSGALEGHDIVPSEITASRGITRVLVERAAAALIGRCDDLTVEGGQHSDCGLVGLWEEFAVDAASE